MTNTPADPPTPDDLPEAIASALRSIRRILDNAQTEQLEALCAEHPGHAEGIRRFWARTKGRAEEPEGEFFVIDDYVEKGEPEEAKPQEARRTAAPRQSQGIPWGGVLTAATLVLITAAGGALVAWSYADLAAEQRRIATKERGHAQEQEAEASRQQRIAEAKETEVRRQADLVKAGDAEIQRLQEVADESQAEAKRERQAARRQEEIAREKEAEARREKAAVLTHVDRFNRLAAVLRLKAAEREEKQLFPAWPEQSARMVWWLEKRARPLQAELPRIRQTLRELEAKALPPTEEQKHRRQEDHPLYPEYQAQKARVESLQMAADVRAGKQKSQVAKLPENLSDDPPALRDMAWEKVDPDRDAKAYGNEALGLELARRALAGCKQENRHSCRHVLAWALFANGLDAEATKAGQAVIAIAPIVERRKYRAQLQKLQQAIASAAETLARAQRECARLEAAIKRLQSYRFAEAADSFLHQTLRTAAARLEAFSDEKGLLAKVRKRLSWAGRIAALTLQHPKVRVRWEDAQMAIREADGVVASKLYGRDRHGGKPLVLAPQIGLVPIGMNPKTRLWEFYHLRSAWDPKTSEDPTRIDIPEHEEDGTIAVGEDTGIVFVLLPGGEYTMGAQKRDPTGPNFDPQAEPDETPRRLTMSPFFLARHELTQGQWLRLSGGSNPSGYGPGFGVPPKPVDLRHPAEQVDWLLGSMLLSKHGLVLPTETQWEYGCRGGAMTPWSSGSKVESLAEIANILDRTGKSEIPSWVGEPAPFADGFVIHAPVASLKPNSYGLHDMHGNVWEWCRDKYGDSQNRVDRGGSYLSTAALVRSANRDFLSPTFRSASLGLRPAREIIQ